MNRSRGGFTLAEVALAIGIVAFAFIALIGVFPVGFTQSRASVEETRATHLAQTIFASLRAADFNNVTAFYDAPAFDLGAVADFTGRPTRENAQLTLHAVFPEPDAPLITFDRAKAAHAGPIDCTVGLWFNKIPNPALDSGSSKEILSTRVTMLVFPQKPSLDSMQFQTIVGDF